MNSVVHAKRKLEEAIMIPAGVEVTQQNSTITVKGKLGTVQRTLINPLVTITKQGDRIILASPSMTRKGKRMLFTFKAHLANMMEGVTSGFIYKLKVCIGHFPFTLKIDGQTLSIANFLGEKIPRLVKLLPNVTVKVDKDIITVTSPDVEAAGQTALNIEKATNVGKRDPRVFQDGCYIIEKPGRKFT